MNAATEVRQSHRTAIARAEARAAADVQLGIDNLAAEICKAQWPWERQVLEGHQRRMEAAR